MDAPVRVALVFGGRSGEHEVSIVSARSVAGALDPARYVILPMAIDRAGRWADPATAAEVLHGDGASVAGTPEFHGVSRLDARLLSGEVDVVLPILHGPYGEDGTIQGLCEMLDLPYTGSGVAATAVTMDKAITKRLLVEAGLPTPRFVTLTSLDWQHSRTATLERCESLGWPQFVKPARLGSSVGISKVRDRAGLTPAIEAALDYDDLLVLEEGVDAREIEVAVLGGDPPFASVPGEVIPSREFYDYTDKYLTNDCQLLAPAPLEPTQSDEVRALAVKSFQALGCEGMARVDFLLERRSGRLLVNELNTIPGFTSISMYPRLLALSGVPYSQLLDRLIVLARERQARRRQLAQAALRPLVDRAR